MTHDRIRSCLAEAGYDAELAPDGSTLTLGFEVGEQRISLVHDFPNELLRVPKFHLADGYAGKLAHVGVSRSGGPGEVCIADEGSTVVNTDRPELVYLETVQKHVELLTRLIEDPEYNRAEQLREFEADWGDPVPQYGRGTQRTLRGLGRARSGGSAGEAATGASGARTSRKRTSRWRTPRNRRRYVEPRNGDRARLSGKR